MGTSKRGAATFERSHPAPAPAPDQHCRAICISQYIALNLDVHAVITFLVFYAFLILVVLIEWQVEQIVAIPWPYPPPTLWLKML